MKVAIWTPSSPAPFLFPKRFKRSLNNLRVFANTIIYGKSSTYNLNYVRNFQFDIVDEFHSYILDESIDLIILSTGGWTSISLLKHINWDFIKNNPKPIIGYSDTTSLLLSIYAKTDVTTYHGPMLISEWGNISGINDYTLNYFKKALNNKNIYIKNSKEWSEETLWWDKEDYREKRTNPNKEWFFLKNGICKGKLVGGNLTTLLPLLGTEFMPKLKNTIFFIEDQELSADKFISMLYTLKLHNVFDEISGLIVGKIANKKNASNGFSDFTEALNIVISEYDFPVIMGVDLGHTDPMITLPIGALAELNSQKKVFRINLEE
ncbi:S66 peptidase family protein [Staphylococcus pseudintermedius]|uniref:S66 family peptidase n=1 Tax=Staphylococcus pseudintermedius TaxID=283734 RepID=UPI002B261E11|nr:S66 peptidase family protein [Staphylococcus pseudintermedius]WQL14962.1 S66 peptidase family protein [Staphylococcus pseudintermedius]